MLTTLHEACDQMLAEMSRPRLVQKAGCCYDIQTGVDTYETGVCETPEQALRWLVHLRDKSWFTSDHETDFLDALQAAGVFGRGP